MIAFKRILAFAATAAIIAPLALSSGCAGSSGNQSSSTNVRNTQAARGGTGYRSHYYGHAWRPWIGFRRPVIVVPPGGGSGGGGIGREVDPDWGVEAPRMPEAVTLPSTPDMGMPDLGGDMGMGMDLGGFDL
ncbi:hypothetical protein [Microbulbifer sp. YPW1]|uniref:hypothetical protein n=1 Tax=Microbulbifer sp. YPW1 TaxID=2745199 RepID=UPI001598E5B4|nr:hypothetical protein [Microbulbifer sp. YPW1]QKX17812.1 hypothetical protein HUW35_12975 [Microbulbifer sp. YPW1]